MPANRPDTISRRPRPSQPRRACRPRFAASRRRRSPPKCRGRHDYQLAGYVAYAQIRPLGIARGHALSKYAVTVHFTNIPPQIFSTYSLTGTPISEPGRVAFHASTIPPADFRQRRPAAYDIRPMEQRTGDVVARPSADSQQASASSCRDSAKADTRAGITEGTPHCFDYCAQGRLSPDSAHFTRRRDDTDYQ